ncbi:MAG: ABC transporter permease [Myxococcales bacterium]|nr:ABC transporter permease [Myxococcales bacterium]
MPTWRRCARDRGRAARAPAPRCGRARRPRDTAGALALRGLLAALSVSLLALPFADEGGRPVLAVLALVFTGLVFSALGVITGIWADTFDQHAFVANIVITPLALVGGVFYSARTLAEPWATLTRLDPLYYLVDVTRNGLTGFHESRTWLALTVAAVVAAAAVGLASTLIARGWRLKP